VDARPIDLTKLFEPTTQYHAPLFQRPYVWTLEKQWEPLWQDIRTAADRLTDGSSTNDDQPHFLGAIVLELREAHELTTKSIIDGQQRITSLQLVIAAARAAARDAGEDNLAKRLDALLFFEEWLVEDSNNQFKMVPTNGDRVAFRLATRHGVTDLQRVPAGDSGRTMEAYAYFRASVEEWLSEVDEASRSEKLRALVTVLRQNLRVVVIDIGREENAQAIFETMNARGTPLLAADLVKNYVFQGTSESRAEFLYAKYWSDFDTQTWRREVGVGRGKRPRIDQLIGNWLILRGEEDLHWQELFLDFKKYRASIEGSPEDLMADLREVASVFDLLERFPMSSREGLFMYRVDVLEANTWRPLAIRIFGGGGIEDPADRLRALVAIESWLVRRMLCRLTTKNYNRVVRSLLDHVAGGPFASESVVEFLASLQGESQVWPDDDMLLSNLRTQPYYTAITRPRLRMVLEAIEADLRGAMNLPFADWNALTIEHVLPQEWSHNWPLPSDRPEIEAGIERDAAKHRLGNLTLVAQALNSGLSNGPWRADADIPQKREGLRKHNVYMLNKPLVELSDWDEGRIRERGDALSDVVLRIWPAPQAFATTPLPVPDPGTPAAAEPVESHTAVSSAGRHRRLWDEYQSLKALDDVDPALGELGRSVMAWAEGLPDMTYLKGQRVPELIPAVTVHSEPLTLFTLSNEGRVFLAVGTWKRVPALSEDSDRRQYLRQINDAVGSSMRSVRAWPYFSASLLYDESRRDAFLKMMKELAIQLRATAPVPEPSTLPEPELASRVPGDLALRYQRFLTDILNRFMTMNPGFTTPPYVGPRNWLPFGAGRTGFSFVWSIAGGSLLRVELYIDVGDRDQNKVFFDRLRADAAEIDSEVGSPIVWERLDEKKGCRLAIYRETKMDRFDSDPELVQWAAGMMSRFVKVMRPRIDAL
jgi:hypothetical protein